MRKITLLTTVLFLSIPVSVMSFPRLVPGVRVTVPLPPLPTVTVTVPPPPVVPLPPPVVFTAPPEVVVLPETQVYVVPSVQEEIFFYDGYWWRPWNGRWYQSLYYDRGWGFYQGVPSWYRGIPYGWRENYRNHLWGGHSWNYHHIHHADLQRNWRTWHDTGHWNKPEHREFTHHHDGRLYSGRQQDRGHGATGTNVHSSGQTTKGQHTTKTEGKRK